MGKAESFFFGGEWMSDWLGGTGSTFILNIKVFQRNLIYFMEFVK